MKEHIVQSGQSLLDVAVIVYGSVAGLAWLIIDNGLNGPVDRIYEGQVLLYRDEAIDQRKKIYLDEYQTIATIKDVDKPEGIGFWQVDEYEVQSTPIVFNPAPYVLTDAGFVQLVVTINIQGTFFTRVQNTTTGQVIEEGQLGYIEIASLTNIFNIDTPGTYEVQVENLVATVTIVI